MRIVQFSNGKYGIRTYWFFGWFFRDLVDIGSSWNLNSRWIGSCMGTKEKCEEIINAINDAKKYKVIK